jgi:hypothetical protein
MVALAMCILLAFPSRSQEEQPPASQPAYLRAGKIGLGLDGITESPNLLLKYFINNQLALQAIAGLDADIPGGTAPPGLTKVTGLNLRGGLSILVHLARDRVSPYAGVEGIFQRAKEGGFFAVVSDPKNSLQAECVAGVEYFLDERFTIGIKLGAGVDVRFKRDTPKEETHVSLATSTVFTGRFYFN